MIKKIFLTLALSSFLTANVFSAGSSDGNSNKTKTNYEKQFFNDHSFSIYNECHCSSRQGFCYE